jgi:hypothetical protein
VSITTDDNMVFTDQRDDAFTNPIPYIQFPDDALVLTNSFSVELFLTAASNNEPSSLLFAFGNDKTYVKFPSFFVKQTVHLVISFNFKEGRASVYVDGSLLSGSQDPKPTVCINGAIYDTSFPKQSSSFSIAGSLFVGRNLLNDSPKMFASIREFR